MKKILAVIIAVMLVCSLAVPAMAAEAEAAADGFTPSITYKPQPRIVPVLDPNGQEHFGVVKNADGEAVDYLEEGCLLITPIAYVWDEDQEVPVEVEDLLTFVYEALSTGEMELPYNLFTTVSLDPENMVIRDLFDARWTCEEHPKMIAPEGVVVELTFDLGVAPDTEIYVMTYDEAAGEWEPIVSTVNNGDGTVTCVFEHLCAITFSMSLVASEAPAAPAASASNGMLWLILLGLAAVAVVAVLVVKNKKPAVK